VWVFKNIRVVDVAHTTIEDSAKQHGWKAFLLRNFMDPQDPTRTIEGYPAPLRAVLIAEI